ncbi:nitroreductase family deazaflavin-dependent oxidoreductase [Candidatus Oscillochloris fontis]|uniref:nitroreductase family deazaflavin-dependent oxidoreductase n=1 Tax=Candidatus Oscillochloris fontis TaxID=2496868 RepID=UPI00101D8494|nr:nitroreductase family deazaflavin-dependent oxidoreductase [Candidatus Oscillochloris fontis]
MSDPNSWLERTLRQAFRYLNWWMLLLWRLGLGPWLSLTPQISGRYLVLNHIGRKSGLRRRTPLNFAEIDGTIYITAGFGAISDWYRNLLANPQVELWLPHTRWRGVAHELPQDHPQRIELLREVLKGSGFVAPLMGVNPYTMSDAQLAAASTAYRLIAMTQEEPATGADGPGDLAWIWLVFAVAFTLINLPRLIPPRCGATPAASAPESCRPVPPRQRPARD